MKTLLVIALWWASGISGFVYWWTNEHDLTWPVAPAAVVAGACLGPLAWGVGWVIHGDHEVGGVIVAKRNNKSADFAQ